MLILLIIWEFKFSPYLWFDEAGQFWIAKGLNHYSDPLQQEQGVAAVIENNAYYNMDPGGFSILLHFWSKLGGSHFWLRVLPLLFFILSIAACVILFYKWTRNPFMAVLAGFTPLFIPVVINLSVELRAYSMEIAGTVIGLIAIVSLSNKLSYKRLFLWGCVLSFFMTSRYAEVIVIFVYSLAILNIIICSGLSAKQKVFSAAAYALPLIVTVGCIYYFSLRIQNPGVNRMFYLTYLDASPGVLLQSKNLLYLFALVIILFLLLLSNRYPLLKRYQLLLFSAFTINAIFLILSLAGKHPWNPFSAACVSMFLVTVICIAALFAALALPFFRSTYAKRFYFAFAVLPVMIVLLLGFYTSTPRERTFASRLGFYYSGLDRFQNMYVDAWESPSIRYMFEYGEYKRNAKGVYPDHFTFEKYGRHNISPGSNHPSLSFGAQPEELPKYRQYNALVGSTFERQGVVEWLKPVSPIGFFKVWTIRKDSAGIDSLH
jgi:hypothetical protein